MNDRHLSAEEINAAFEGMVEDKEHQAEVARIMQEFALADMEAWSLAEGRILQGWDEAGERHA